MVDVACFRKGDVFAAYKGISQPLQHFSHCTESGIQSESRRCRILRGTTRLNSGVELVAALYGMRTVAEPSHSAMWSSVCNNFLQEAPSNLPDLPREPLEKDECEEWLGRAQETDEIACCFVDRWNWCNFFHLFHVSHWACGSVLAISCDFSIWFPGGKAWDHDKLLGKLWGQPYLLSCNQRRFWNLTQNQRNWVSCRDEKTWIEHQKQFKLW